jgi:type III pantothenate kinase
MILAIDAGNTRIKWGLHDGAAWAGRGALALAEAEELAASITAPPAAIVAANVAGAEVARRIEASLARWRIPIRWASAQASQCGVVNGYDNPQQLGADRWAALIGARHLHAGAGLVVNAGTATTVDVLDSAGVFRGGLILPGFDLMRACLAHNTAQLPWSEGQYRDYPRNTADAIVSGCVHAQAGAVERMFAALSGDGPALCLLCGGAAGLLAPALRVPHRLVDNLVLEGLVRIAAAA